MEEIIFNLKDIKIQCNPNEKMKDICDKFKNKIRQNINYYNYFYNSKKIKEELTFLQQANKIDIKNKKMNIIVNNSNDSNFNNENGILPNEILCPECGESIRINFKDYKIDLFECKNDHKFNNILLENFKFKNNEEKSEIICSKCNLNKNNRADVNFYKCYTCGIFLCQSCNLNQKHNTFEYHIKDYKCIEHNLKFNSYCTECKKNICVFCEKEHIDHNVIYYKDIFKNEGNLKDDNKDLKIKIDLLKDDINEIIKILYKIINNLDIYYKINKYYY